MIDEKRQKVRMRIVGISPAHDSSVAVYNDGEIEFFIKEERLSRVKRDKQPFLSIVEAKNYLQDKVVDAVVITSPIAQEPYVEVIKDFARKIFDVELVYDMSNLHHLSHAALAFYNSGFEESIIIVIDRNGSRLQEPLGLAAESETIFTASYPNTFTEIRKNYWATNIGADVSMALDAAIELERQGKKDCHITCNSSFGITKVYETATTLIGEHILENGKTMGLSSYGNKNLDFTDLFLEDGSPVDQLFTHVTSHHDGSAAACYKKYIQYMTKNVTKDNYSLYANYAYQVQKQTQEQVRKLVEYAISNTGITNVCVTGGYGLNVVTNGYLISSFPHVNFFFEPLADDSGNSIGSAMFLYREFTKDTKIQKISSTFFSGKDETIETPNLTDFAKNKINTEKVPIAHLADLLVTNKSVAIFNGIAEAGPRALGNRSILFYPTLENTKELVNLIKKREWYRPFAACVLEEDANMYFDMLNVKNSPYMTISFNCKKDTSLYFPGIVHVDNSCRVQTVGKDNKYLYDILSEVKKKSGHGLLLNTSLNIAGSPLAQTFNQAIDILLNTSLDYLFMPSKMLLYSKKAI